MELGLAALATLGAEAGAAAGAAGLAAGAAEAGAGVAAMAGGGGLLSSFFSSPVLSILAGTTTAVSAIQQLNQGELKAQQAEFQAAVTRNDAIGAQAEGLQRQNAINRELLKTLGENDVAYAASGVDLSYGEASGRRSRSLSLASDESAIASSGTRAKLAGYEAQALNYDRMSRQYRSGALLGALADGGKAVLQFGRRGVA